MENEQINEILADMISAYMAPGLSRKATRKLTASEVADSAEIKVGNAFEAVRDALAKCGNVLGSEGESMVYGVILSGAASMNPCYVTVRLDGGHAEIKAYAKEGLIKQHTAEKAVKLLKEALLD